MKANSNVLLREIAGEKLLVLVGELAGSFQGIMSLNGSGLLLWKSLQQERTEEDLVGLLMEKYDVDAETANEDVRAFLDQLDKANVLVR